MQHLQKTGVPPSSQMLFSLLAPRPVPIPPSHSPYTLPSSVSCKSFACHSYENTRGVGVFFPFWNSSPVARRARNVPTFNRSTCQRPFVYPHSFHTLAHSFARSKNSTLLFS